MFEMIALIMGFFVLFIPPVLAYKGKGFRGLWAGMIVVGALIAFIGMEMVNTPTSDADMVAHGLTKQAVELTGDLFFAVFLMGVGWAISSLLAVCFYRKSPL